MKIEEGHRLFDNRVLMWIFGPERMDVTGWRKLHNEELHNFTHGPLFGW
jgi:hypothetical protein